MEGLNAKYGGGFYLFFRRPAFHAVDERYMGWERKRGALVELVRLLKGRRSGLEVLEEMLSLVPNIRVIMCSAVGQEMMIQKALTIGAADFIVKPFKADEFSRIVNRCLEQ